MFLFESGPPGFKAMGLKKVIPGLAMLDTGLHEFIIFRIRTVVITRSVGWIRTAKPFVIHRWASGGLRLPHGNLIHPTDLGETVSATAVIPDRMFRSRAGLRFLLMCGIPIIANTYFN
jgi:hypothetical protein